VSRIKLTLGALYQGDGLASFRVWAPERRAVDVALETAQGTRYLPLKKGAHGYFEGVHPAEPGARYRYRLDGDQAFPDPCSRFQPEGPHGPSLLVEPSRYGWRDGGWKGLPLKGQVLYELHVGAFSPEGTYEGVRKHLPALKEVGVTCLELMPLATCPGRFNWGYDGVALFAPMPTYGSPDELRRLVDEAHALGMGIILDVVYNHLGPDGNYLAQYSKLYTTTKYPGEWGDPIRFEGEEAKPVRDFFIQNAVYWISEFHFDGLRLDATQSIFDASTPHVITELAQAARDAAEGRQLLIIGENEPQDRILVKRPEEGGYGLDGLWVDDFHHTIRVAASGRAEAYTQDYGGTAQELVSCVTRNSLYQGQYYAWQKKPRGSVLRGLPPAHVVFFLQNHDQIANVLKGQRLHHLGGEGVARAFTTFWLMLPQTPLLFMGQEYFASQPFFFFVDHVPELQKLVNKGRKEFVCQFPSAQCGLEREGFELPSVERAFQISTLDPAEREKPGHREAWALHKALLTLRREDPVISAQDGQAVEGAVLSQGALVLRYTGQQGSDRLLLLNLGSDLRYEPCPEPLLAPLPGTRWKLLLSSEEIRFGGGGVCHPDGTGRWLVPGKTALVLASEELPK